MDSPRASRILKAARAPLDRPRRLSLPDEGRPKSTLAEHQRLLDSIKSGDAEFADAAMRLHLSRVAVSVERALQQIEINNG